MNSTAGSSGERWTAAARLGKLAFRLVGLGLL